MLFNQHQERTKTADECLPLWWAGRRLCGTDDVPRLSLQSAVEVLLEARNIYIKAQNLGSERILFCEVFGSLDATLPGRRFHASDYQWSRGCEQRTGSNGY